MVFSRRGWNSGRVKEEQGKTDSGPKRSLFGEDPEALLTVDGVDTRVT